MHSNLSLVVEGEGDGQEMDSGDTCSDAEVCMGVGNRAGTVVVAAEEGSPWPLEYTVGNAGSSKELVHR